MAGQYRFKDDSGNIVAQISASVDGVISFSGSQVNFSEVNTINLGDVQLAGTASNALLLDGFDSQAFAFTSSIHPFTASIAGTNSFTASIVGTNAFTASLVGTNTFTSSTNSRLNSIETISASNISRINSLEITSASVNTLNTTQNSRLDSLEAKTGSLASTGSNTFIGTQTVTGSLFVSANLIVQGTSSLQNITASAVSIGTNIVNLNTANPAVRYAGLVIGDSGSIGSSGSFLYDSVQDEMIFVHRGANATVTSSVTLMGPQTFDNIGNETYLTNNRITKGTGNEHLVDSNITDIGNSIGIGITNPTYPLTRNGMTFRASGTDGAEFVMLSSTDTGFTGGALVRNGTDFGIVNRTNGNLIFATNATEWMYITSGGSVGIGITNPQKLLHILYPSNIGKDTIEGVIRLTGQANAENAGDTLSAGVGIEFYNRWNGGGSNAEYSVARISGRASQGYDGGLQFDVANNTGAGQSNFTNAITILKTGNVGIATTSPTGILNVWGDGSTDIIKATRSSVTRFVVKNGTNTVGINTDTVNSALTVNGTVDMVGNVGINTTSAYSPLTLRGAGIAWGESMTIYPSPSGYTTLAFRLQGTDTINGTWAIGKQSNTVEATIEYLQIAKNGLTGGALHRADAVQTFDPATGNALFGFRVGVGTTNPNSALHINGGGTIGTRGIISEFRDSSNNQRIDIRDEVASTQQPPGLYSPIAGYGLGLYATAGPMMFYTNGNTTSNERMRIDTVGRVTRPSQPSFLAYSTGFTVTAGSWYNVSNAITTETYDIGSNYSGGRFTAPVAGRYLFYAGGWAAISANGERYAWCARINDGGLFYIGGGNYCITDSPLAGYTIVYNLAAGDYVDLWVFSAVGGQWGGGSHSIWWGGYLL